MNDKELQHGFKRDDLNGAQVALLSTVSEACVGDTGIPGYPGTPGTMGDPGMMVEPEPMVRRRVKGKWQWVPAHISKHAGGKATKRKRRHRKGG